MTSSTRGTVYLRIRQIGTFLIFACLETVIFTPRNADAIDVENDFARITFDTTISYGQMYRLQKQDLNLIGPARGGNNEAASGADNGNANYQRGLVGNTIKGTHELEIHKGPFGVFGRATYFVDFRNALMSELAQEDKRQGAHRLRFLDAYASANVGPLSFRLGWQVVSWGESLFFQGGINSANAADLTLLRVPGSELREALLPSPMAWASIEVVEGLSIEGFYTARFEHLRFEACGTYFSTNDLLCRGGPEALSVPTPRGNVPVSRGKDILPPNWREFGFALRYLAPALQSTEFGLYVMQHHSRVPIVSAVAGAPLPQAVAEYPDAITLLGGSFNSEIPRLGIGVQGEYAHRFNAPLQLHPATLLPSAFSSAPGTHIPGFKRFQTGQWSLLLSKNFASSNPFFADNMQLIAEVAGSIVYDLPGADDPETILSSPDPTTDEGGNPRRPDKFAMGYQVLLVLDYLNAIGPVSLQPTFSFSHNPFHTAPVGGSFIEGRSAVKLSIIANYINMLTFELSYSGFFGATSKGNTTHDRDFLAATFRYYI